MSRRATQRWRWGDLRKRSGGLCVGQRGAEGGGEGRAVSSRVGVGVERGAGALEGGGWGSTG